MYNTSKKFGGGGAQAPKSKYTGYATAGSIFGGEINLMVWENFEVNKFGENKFGGSVMG